jgi:RND superfamily putative drug exporter
MKQMGVGLAAAILIDATLIRAVILPALMTALGRSNWWTPRWLRPRAERIATEETRVLEPVS